MTREYFIAVLKTLGRTVGMARFLERLDEILAHDAEQRAEIERLREALELYKRASYQSHAGHWDKTGGGGSGCPASYGTKQSEP